MKTSSAFTLLTVLSISSAFQFIAPAQAYDMSSTQNSTIGTPQTIQLAQFGYSTSRDRCPNSDNRAVQQLLNSIENRTDNFRSSLDRALDDSRLNGSQREDNINQIVTELAAATDRLRERFRRNQDLSEDIREVFRRADRIDNFMSRRRLDERAERDWSSLRQDINQLERLSNRGGKCLDSNNGSIKQLINRIESRTNVFRSALDQALDRSRLDGSKREDNINQFVRDFETATNRLRDRHNNGQNISSDVREVLRRADRIDNFMRRRRLDQRTTREWANLRRDLNELSRISNLSREF